MSSDEPQKQKLRLYGTVADSIVDGPGMRYSIFVQGCAHACPGCHNPESQPYEGGIVRDIEDILQEIASNKLIEGVTFSGGEPFDQPAACAELARKLKARGYNIWAYTGYLIDDLLRPNAAKQASRRDFLEQIDVLVDGPFVEKLKSMELDWRGSSNQRIIDVPGTLAADARTQTTAADARTQTTAADSHTLTAGSIVIWQPPAGSTVPDYPIPESW